MSIRERLNLSGKTALITGAGVGLGRATALALAEAGAFVGIHYRRSETEAHSALDAVRALGADGILLQADLSQEAPANSIVDRLIARTGRLDILVNNAGDIIRRARIEDCTLEDWHKTMDVNMTSAFLVTKRAIPHLRASGNGRIVNILSLAVQTGGANGAGSYAAAKGALEVFTRTLARELAPEVLTNSICPGVIETRHHEVHTRPERMAEYRRETPLGRNGTADEVAMAVLYLASEAGAFTNGALIDVNGGRFLR